MKWPACIRGGIFQLWSSSYCFQGKNLKTAPNNRAGTKGGCVAIRRRMGRYRIEKGET